MNKINQTKGKILIKIIIASLLFISITGIVFLLRKGIVKQNNIISNPNIVSKTTTIVSETTTTSQTIMPNIDLQNKIVENWSTSEKVIMLQSFQPEVLPANYSGKIISNIVVSPDYKKILYVVSDVKVGHGSIEKLVFKNLEKNIKVEISSLFQPTYRSGENQSAKQNNIFFFDRGEFSNNSNLALVSIIELKDEKAKEISEDTSNFFLIIVDCKTGEYKIEKNIKFFHGNVGFFQDGTIYYFQKDTDRIKGYFGGKSITLPADIGGELSCELKDNFLLCTAQKEESDSYLTSVFVFNTDGQISYEKIITEKVKYNSFGYKINFWVRLLAYNEKNNQLIYTRTQDGEDLLYQNDTLITLPINYKYIDSATFDNMGALWIVARKDFSDNYFVIKDGRVINNLRGLSPLFISDDKSQIAYRGRETIDNQKYESVFVNGQKVFSRAGDCLNRSLPCPECCDTALNISPDNKSIAIILDSKTKKGYFSLRINQVDVEDLELKDIIEDPLWLNNETIAVIEGLNKNVIQGEDMAQTITYGKKRIHLINIKGKLIWSSPLLDDIFSKPILIDNKIIFVGQEGKEIVQKVYEIVN